MNDNKDPIRIDDAVQVPASYLPSPEEKQRILDRVIAEDAGKRFRSGTVVRQEVRSITQRPRRRVKR